MLSPGTVKCLSTTSRDSKPELSVSITVNFLPSPAVNMWELSHGQATAVRLKVTVGESLVAGYGL